MAIQETVTTHLGNTLQALDAVKARMDALERSTKRTNAAAKETQATLGKRLAAGSKVGGAGGTALGNFGSSVGMGDGMAALGIGAVAVGVAYQQLTRIIRQRTANERQLVQLSNRLADSYEQAAKQHSAGAIQGLQQSGAVRTLSARGGSVGEAGTVAKQLGISFEEAAQGLAEIALLPAELRTRAKNVAAIAQQSGLAGYAETASTLRRDPLARSDAGAGPFAQDAAAAVISRMLQTNITPEYLQGGYKRDQANPIIGQQREANRIQLKIDTEARKRAESGEAVHEMRKQLAAFLDPQSAALIEYYKEINRTTQELERMSKAAGWLGNLLDGGNSARLQLLRTQRITADAVLEGQSTRGGR